MPPKRVLCRENVLREVQAFPAYENHRTSEHQCSPKLVSGEFFRTNVILVDPRCGQHSS